MVLIIYILIQDLEIVNFKIGFLSKNLEIKYRYLLQKQVNYVIIINNLLFIKKVIFNENTAYGK